MRRGLPFDCSFFSHLDVLPWTQAVSVETQESFPLKAQCCERIFLRVFSAMREISAPSTLISAGGVCRSILPSHVRLLSISCLFLRVSFFFAPVLAAATGRTGIGRRRPPVCFVGCAISTTKWESIVSGRIISATRVCRFLVAPIFMLRGQFKEDTNPIPREQGGKGIDPSVQGVLLAVCIPACSIVFSTHHPCWAQFDGWAFAHTCVSHIRL